MTVEERLAALEHRLRRVEDELAISHLMASYGPLVDAGDGEAVAALWTEDARSGRGELADDCYRFTIRSGDRSCRRVPFGSARRSPTCAHP